METWFIILISLCISALLKALFNLIVSPSSSSSSSSSHKKLPPGPTIVPVIGNFIWMRKSFSEIEPLLRDLRSKYGPIITLRLGSRPAIFVASHSIAHRALIQNGALFSDRPKSATGQVINSNQHNISSAAYGPTWRLLQRNLTSEILHPSRVKSYSRARRWVLGILMERLVVDEEEESRSSNPVKVVDHFQYAMFCLLVLMCFGDRLEEKQIKDVERVQRQLLLSFGRFNVLNFWPRIGKMVFRKRWKELMCLRQNQEDVLIPLIRARIEVVKQKRQQLTIKGKKQNYSKEEEEEESEERMAYVDTLFDLELPDEKRKLNDGEIVTLCGEFLDAGTDTTSTALQWIMANLVKYPRVQAKLYQEIAGVMGPPPTLNKEQVGGGGERSKYDKEIMMRSAAIGEEDLQRMPYLKAVVLEGLRRHPLGHFVLPHKVTEDVELEGYLVPKNATVNFMVADMGWDPKVWEEPMEFKPERFLINSNNNNNNNKIDDVDDGGKLGGGGGEALFDLTGSREIKMMPFGAGRRICPGSGLALLHLEYFVANLVWYFEWTTAVGDDLDLSEKQEFTMVMKNPLRAHISPRATA